MKLTDSDVEYIIREGLVTNKYKMLWFTENQLSSHSIHRLASAMNENSTLEGLSLCANELTDNDLIPLIQTLSTTQSTLQRLALTSNQITDDGVQQIAEMLKVNLSLKQLWLGFNQITDQGAQILMNILAGKNQTLQILSLSWNSMITDASIDSILEMFESNRTLKMIALINCHISETGRAILRQAANNHSEFYFDF